MLVVVPVVAAEVVVLEVEVCWVPGVCCYKCKGKNMKQAIVIKLIKRRDKVPI